MGGLGHIYFYREGRKTCLTIRVPARCCIFSPLDGDIHSFNISIFNQLGGKKKKKSRASEDGNEMKSKAGITTMEGNKTKV